MAKASWDWAGCTRVVLTGLVVLAVGVGLGACGSDDAAAVASSEGTTDTAADPGSSGAGEGGGSADGGTGGTPDDVPTPTTPILKSDRLLPNDAPVVIQFAASMQPQTLVYSGLAVSPDKVQWSTRSLDNDTLTIYPAGTWPTGLQTLAVHAADQDGNVVAITTELRITFFDRQVPTVIGAANLSQTGSLFQLSFGNPAIDELSTPPKLVIPDYIGALLFIEGVPQVDGFPTVIPSAVGNVNPQSVHIQGPNITWTEYRENRIALNTLNGFRQGESSRYVGANVAPPDRCPALVRPEAAVVTPNGKFIVTDGGRNRVLIWNSLATTSGPADLVLGRIDPNDVYCYPRLDAPTRDSFKYPAGVWSDGVRMVVMDYENDRVLVWRNFPTADVRRPDLVLGHDDFTTPAVSNAMRVARLDAAGLNQPYPGVDSSGSRLAIADTGNNRILIWDVFPTTNNQPPDRVIGGFQTATQLGSNMPSGVRFFGNLLLVVDRERRVLVFRV